MPTTHNPDEAVVIRPLTPRITTVSLPFTRAGLVRIGGRATIVKLASGALAVFSPVALTSSVRTAVADLGGDVRYIIAPDIEHHMSVSEWKAAFPAARLVGPAGLPKKRARQDKAHADERWDHLFSKSTKHAMRITDEFDRDFDYEFVDGHANSELVLLFKPDRVLLQADLFFNLPATEQYSRSGGLGRLSLLERLFYALNSCESGRDEASLKWTRRWIWYVVSSRDRSSFDESVRRIDGWDFGTVVPCHGDVLEGDEGKRQFRRVMKWHLGG